MLPSLKCASKMEKINMNNASAEIEMLYLEAQRLKKQKEKSFKDSQIKRAKAAELNNRRENAKIEGFIGRQLPIVNEKIGRYLGKVTQETSGYFWRAVEDFLSFEEVPSFSLLHFGYAHIPFIGYYTNFNINITPNGFLTCFSTYNEHIEDRVTSYGHIANKKRLEQHGVWDELKRHMEGDELKVEYKTNIEKLLREQSLFILEGVMFDEFLSRRRNYAECDVSIELDKSIDEGYKEIAYHQCKLLEELQASSRKGKI